MALDQEGTLNPSHSGPHTHTHVCTDIIARTFKDTSFTLTLTN